jgi:hypothetical protein
MTADRPNGRGAEPPLALLEQALIEEFIRDKGYDPDDLSALPEPVREALRREASVYASARLSEVESRSQFIHEIHDGGGPRRNGPE